MEATSIEQVGAVTRFTQNRRKARYKAERAGWGKTCAPASDWRIEISPPAAQS